MCRPSSEAVVFARGPEGAEWEPLRRFLLPLPAQVVEHFAPVWCRDPDASILIPFSQSAAALQVAARYGRVFASDPNPLTALVQRMQLAPPPAAAIRKVVGVLGDRLVKGQRLAEAVMHLYDTPCPSCGRALTAEAFLWDREQGRPVQRRIRCAPCGLDGWVKVAPEDLAPFAEPEHRGFHYWRVLDLLARRGEALYPVARQFLGVYTPRNLRALDLLVLEVPVAFPGEEGRLFREVAWVLLVGCLEQCASLQPAEGLPMPRRLRPARRFLERNVWLVLREVAAYWERLAEETGDGLGEPGVQVRFGSVGEAFGALEREGAPLALCSPPPPHPVFWHLVYFWTCWLWGRAEGEKVRALLHLSGPSWTWYVQALTRAMRVVAAYLEETAPLVLWMRQDRYLAEAVLLAAASAGFVPVSGAAQAREISPLSSGGAEVVAFFRRGRPAAPRAESEQVLGRMARSAVWDLLVGLQEPASLVQLGAACYWRMLEEGDLPRLFAAQGGLLEMVRSIEGRLRKELTVLAKDGQVEGLGPWEEPAGEGASAARWPQFWRWRRPWEEDFPLTDRAESLVWAWLLEHPGERAETLFREVYARFGGLCTPPAGWVEECLRSYGQQEGGEGTWRLRPEDRPEHRWEELPGLLDALHTLGQALGFRVVEQSEHVGQCRTCWGEVPASLGRRSCPEGVLPFPFAVGWLDEGRLQYAFVLSWTSSVVPVVVGTGNGPAALRRCLVFPGGRSSLLHYRRTRAAWLPPFLSRGNWRFVKFRHLRQLAAEPQGVGRTRLEQVFGLDPIVERPDAQMPLF